MNKTTKQYYTKSFNLTDEERLILVSAYGIISEVHDYLFPHDFDLNPIIFTKRFSRMLCKGDLTAATATIQTLLDTDCDIYEIKGEEDEEEGR